MLCLESLEISSKPLLGCLQNFHDEFVTIPLPLDFTLNPPPSTGIMPLIFPKNRERSELLWQLPRSGHLTKTKQPFHP